MSYNQFMDNHSYVPKIITRIIDGDECLASLLIEGDKETLNFIADWIKELANDDGQIKASIYPDGAGCAYFSEGSRVGIYLNKIKK